MTTDDVCVCVCESIEFDHVSDPAHIQTTARDGRGVNEERIKCDNETCTVHTEWRSDILFYFMSNWHIYQQLRHINDEI